MNYLTIKNSNLAFSIIKSYDGDNPYILLLKKEIYITKKLKELNSFQIEYVIKNNDKTPVLINRITYLADWYAIKKKEDWNLDFIPNKIKILYLIGETDSAYHCYAQYRKSEPPRYIFIPKKAVLKNFTYEDYNNLSIDFDKYDKISTAKDPNRKLKEHQKEAIKFLVSRKKCLLADDMGYGKTTELIVGALESNYDNVLIICPASIKTNWKRELKWYVDENKISIIESIQEKNKRELEELLGYAKNSKKKSDLLIEAKKNGKWQNNKFVIVNFDILDEFYKIPLTWSAKNVENAYNNSPMLQYIKSGNSLIIIDEVHKLSNSSSNRYKIVKDLIKRGSPKGIFLATGTPITNKPLNYYNVLSFLNDPITNDWEYYVERYCNGFKIPAKGEKEKYTKIFLNKIKKNNIYELTNDERDSLKKFIYEKAKLIWINNGSSNLDELKMRTSHIYLRRVKEDIMGNLKKNIHEIYYDLTYDEKIEYEKLWDEYEKSQTELDVNKELNKELIEGSIYRKYISDIMVPHTIELVNELIEDDNKVIIGCCYDDELYKLQSYFKDKCVIYNGKMNSKQKDKSEFEFMNNPKIKVFIGNIIAAGVGINLVAANKLVFNNMSFVPGDNKQFEDRIFRIGQKNDVDIYYQIFSGTQYDRMWNIVLKKAYIIDQIIKKEDDKK